MKKERIGSHFDDFLRAEHLLEVAEATAAKRVIGFQIAQGMSRRPAHEIARSMPMNGRTCGCNIALSSTVAEEGPLSGRATEEIREKNKTPS